MQKSQSSGRISEISRLMNFAVRSGEQGLRKRHSAGAQELAASMTQAYERALSLSLTLSLTARDCNSFDEKSHQIELIRTRLECRIEELAEREAYSRSVYIPEKVNQFFDHCTRITATAWAMLQANAPLTHRPFRG
jgi:hypothetical protein